VILAAIGKLDRIVACTKYCADVCPEISPETTIVADSWTASTEQIVAARPDLVIAAVPYQEKAVTEILKSGARFLGSAPKTLDDIYTDIAAIAGVMGASDRGEEVIREMQREIDSVRAQANRAKPSRVFCEEWGKPLICSQPWVAELVAAAGGEFVGIPGKQTSAEAVLLENPDVVVAAWCGAGDRVPLENHSRARMGTDASRERESRLLHSRRISEHPGADPDSRFASPGCRHSSGRFSTTSRSKMH
jgi:iron complex transport system substrate-binding protein